MGCLFEDGGCEGTLVLDHEFSLMVIFFLSGIVFVIFLTVRRDLTRYDELDKEAQIQLNAEKSGWKLIVGDVFREPTNSKLLYVMVGEQVQITRMAVVFSENPPASRGMLLTGMIIIYLFLGIVAGYFRVQLWRTIKTNFHWVEGSCLVHCLLLPRNRIRHPNCLHASLCGRLEVVVEGFLCFRFSISLRVPILHQLLGF